MTTKPNPFEKLAKPAAKKVTAASVAEDETVPAAPVEDTVVAESKARLAAKKAAAAQEEVAEDAPEKPAAPKRTRTVKPKPEPVVEEEEVDEEEEDSTPLALADIDPEDDEDDEEDETEAKEAPAPKKATRRTAKQVEEEAAAKQAELEAQIEALRVALEGKADMAVLDIGIVKDRVVLEGGEGGDVRVVGAGKTLVNDDWRCTADGLRLILGRSSMQSTQQFHIPLSLVSSLAELLSNVTEIQD